MCSELWCSARGHGGNTSLKAPWGDRCRSLSLLRVLCYEKKITVKHASQLSGDMDRELEIRENVNGICKEMKL